MYIFAYISNDFANDSLIKMSDLKKYCYIFSLILIWFSTSDIKKLSKFINAGFKSVSEGIKC